MLITTLVLSARSGTEVVTEQLADGLRRAGHTVAVLAPKLGPQAEAMRISGHLVIDRIGQLPWRPDIIHGQHNVTTMIALAALPETPAVYYCHDASAPFDQPPSHPRIGRYLAVDGLCRDRVLGAGVRADRVTIIANAVDERRYPPRSPLPERPQTALALTKTAGQLALLRRVCAERALSLDVLGPAGPLMSDRLDLELPRYDLVFATARMALEAAFVGCAVIVSDGRGHAGMLASSNLDSWRAANFGRALLVAPPSEASLLEAIDAYDANDAAAVSARLQAVASLSQQIEVLLACYEDVIRRHATIHSGETAALAAFLEDYLPTHAIERPWRELAAAIGDDEPVDIVAPLVGRVRNDLKEHIERLLRVYHAGHTDALGARYLPARDFTAINGAFAHGTIACALAELDGYAVTGPYAKAPAGDYEALFDLEWDQPAPRADTEFELDVTADGSTVLAQRHYLAEAPSTPAQRTLRFTHANAEAALEFRIRGGGFSGGRLRFRGVVLKRLC
ncbi:MAG: glycosyltransferase [Hyphomonadaceae bacterium]